MAKLINIPEKVAEDHYLLKIQYEGTECEPGQFINIKATENYDPLLRRPFSIFDAGSNIMEVVIRVIGKGTKLISNMEPGDIDIVGPTGKGFTMEENGDLLLVGGGVGNAPLLYLMRKLKEKGNRLTYIYCARNSDYIFNEEKFRELADEVIITTDDGSAGVKGFATEVMSHIISDSKFDRIYTCGPDPMMGRVVKIAHEDVPVEVSVENYFGCGVGLCVGCTVDTIDGFKRACVEGPVFNGRDILWKNMPH